MAHRSREREAGEPRGAEDTCRPVQLSGSTSPRSRYRLWRWSDVTHWFTTQLGETDIPDERFMIAVNASLELRRHRDELAPDSRNRLRALAGLS